MKRGKKHGSPSRSPGGEKRAKSYELSSIHTLGANACNSFVKRAAETADLLQPLVDKNLLAVGCAVFSVRCSGRVLPTTASLSESMMITLDDAESTPAQSISQLKALICSKHGVHNTTNPKKSVFFGEYSVHALEAAASRMDADSAAAGAAVQPSATAAEDEDEDEDDYPGVTDSSLTAPGCAYQLARAAIRSRTFRQFDNNMLHTAMRDVLASNDPAMPDAFEHLCNVGVPRQSLTGDEPYSVLAARRHDHPKYRSLLVTLASYGYDFDTPSVSAPHETAKSIIEARAPDSFASIREDGWRRNQAL
jgi:hypothetical protein